METKDIVRKVYEAGVVGAGGAGFPTHVKLGAKAEIVLVNGAECEPLLKVDQQLAARHAAELVRGLALSMQATGAREGIVALKAKYAEAIAAITPLLRDDMRIHILQDVYPAGDEVITIWMTTGRRVPPGGIPLNIGVVVNNVQTLINVARAVDHDRPVTHRDITVTGAVRQPVTVTLPLGTPLREALALAGGLSIPAAEAAFIDGGPMMGGLLESLDTPVSKTTGGLIALPADHLLIRRRRTDMRSIISMARTVCEQCLLCTELCPRHLIGHELPPHLIVRSVNYNHVAQPSVLLSALTCSECGICEAYACPVEISPMRINQELKAQFRKEGARYQGELRKADPMIEGRLLPVGRLVARLGLTRFNVKAPWSDAVHAPERVWIRLRQHIGVPAVPCIRVGDAVRCGQRIADMPANAMGAPVHASIDGVVESIGADAIVIKGA
ncbi:SLBB domain-containing protein [Thauera linaloolentis]|uniref:Respiratory-chain NADH dehydrogenase domain 51 kDa subunit n=1 Tax=Thauera linaloolentis (strain DSM 12138 / JCM 21573 / CCUG 41526 / CIP 105981 / IAM 15112 / NBRC 102519 / 47Lol) TaxID=1123367 RepID=N6YT14_THAL4|nr:SLBB domain-containing protein [Thauera linaloolentis]ENO85522.1 respiratory-chain NADH dehydrogenase domain 51 kDa subunit [Thauera linaloolentis 47Lol = DSM 12138]MCM8564761.1 SLBB domain-containing protein [Thauera linaloolentis]